MRRFFCSWNFFKHFILSLLTVILVMCAEAAVSGPVSTQAIPGPVISEGSSTYTTAVIYFKGIPDYIILLIFLILLAFYRPVKKLFKRTFKEKDETYPE